jgi:hypothetical protein
MGITTPSDLGRCLGENENVRMRWYPLSSPIRTCGHMRGPRAAPTIQERTGFCILPPSVFKNWAFFLPYIAPEKVVVAAYRMKYLCIEGFTMVTISGKDASL